MNESELSTQLEETSLSALANLGRRNAAEDGERKDPIRRLLKDSPSLVSERPKLFKRLCRTCLFVAPMLEEAAGRPLHELTVLEIGCGRGSRTLAIAPLVKQVIACDIDPSTIREARGHVAEAGLSNVEFVVGGGQDVLSGDLARDCDVITLYAILEHTTLQERAEMLTVLLDEARKNQVVYIGETPNRLAAFDHHSSQLPFFQSLPDELALKYLDRSRRRDYADDICRAADPVERLYRRGRGPSFHEFDLFGRGLDNFDASVVVGPDHNTLLNLYAYDRDAHLLQSRLEFQGIPRSDLFSRHYLEFALRIGGPKAPQVRVLDARQMEASQKLLDPRRLLNAIANSGECVKFAVEGGSSVSLGILLGALNGEVRSRGRFRIETSAGWDHEFAMQDLMRWRPRYALYHNYAFVDVPLSGGETEVLIRPCGRRHTIAISSAFVRHA